MKSTFGPHHEGVKPNDTTEGESVGSESLYEYEPLAPGEIRILVLLEADDFSDDLECALLSFPLAHLSDEGSDPGSCGESVDDDSFTALSYVWGEDRASRAVYIGDKVLYIGRNLDSALRYLRHRDREMLLWVDAICINQFDLKERNHQVQQMRDIFECASETIAYLGDHDEGNIAHSAWNYLERHSYWALNEDLEKDFTIPKQREDETSFRGDLYDVFHTILTKQWFQRVWVFQEAVVSKRLSIQSRHRRVPWDDFIRCTVLQSRVHDRYGQSLNQLSGFDFAHQLWQARVAFHGASKQERYLPTWYAQHIDPIHDVSTDMLDMLVLARRRHATDPRDKIFALLGVSTGFDWQSQGLVDYGKTTAEVYQDFATDYMITKKDYRPLSYLNRATKLEHFEPQRKRRVYLYQDNMEDADPAVLRDENAVNALEAVQESALLFGDQLTQHISPHSQLFEGKDELGQPGPIARKLAPRRRGLIEDLRGYDEAEPLSLPTWVSNWDGKDDWFDLPRAIVEVVDPIASPESTMTTAGSTGENDMESYRTWIDRVSITGRIAPRGTIAMQGCVLGKVCSGVTSTSLLGRDESLFAELRTRLRQKQSTPLFPFEAYVLSLWTILLKKTWVHNQVEFEVISDRDRRPHRVKPHTYRNAIVDIDHVLTSNPFRRMLQHFDVATLPPKPGSIEAYLVERAEMGTDWSADSVALQRVVPAPKSIVDIRLLGFYRQTKLFARQRHPRDVLLQEKHKARHGTSHGAVELVLLPPDAKFGDLVVMFPGAKVPFLVRQASVCGMEDASTWRVNRGNLPRIETAKLYVECALVGECWINGFDELAREEKVFDTVFAVQ